MMLEDQQKNVIQAVCDGIATSWVNGGRSLGSERISIEIDAAFHALQCVYPDLSLNDTVTRRLAKTAIFALPHSTVEWVDAQPDLEEVFKDLEAMLAK